MILKKIAVVDDEEHIRSLLEDLLEREKFTVISCADTEEAYARIIKSQPDLIILDIKIPRIGGIQLCRLLRENPQTSGIPIIMLTVESSETDKVIGLEAGADDYVTKPFSTKELMARVHAVLRRMGRKPEGQAIKVDGLEMNLVSRTVTLNKKQVVLRPKEFDLLHMFISKPNIMITREAILETVFDCQALITTRTIDTHLKNLRHALGPWGKKIQTVFGRGFKFVPSEHKK
ncbi:MAG: response regulator transcription factor [Endomicrobiales bacterium]|nr:response regulator transcription factor [Endomicrobiales bacterium]